MVIKSGFLGDDFLGAQELIMFDAVFFHMFLASS